MPKTERRERNAYMKAWNAAHPESVKATKAAHYAANRARILAGMAVYRAANAEKRRQMQKAWRAANRTKIREYNAAYSAAHPEQAAVLAQRRIARQRHALVNDLSASQWQEIKAHYGHRCIYCRRKMARLTMDHIIPLVKGGSHTVANIVPACRSCNSKKQAGPPLCPVQPLLLTVAKHRKRRLA